MRVWIDECLTPTLVGQANARGYWALTPPALFVLWIGLIARYAVAPSVTVMMRSFFLGLPAVICILVLVLIFTPSRTPNRFN